MSRMLTGEACLATTELRCVVPSRVTAASNATHDKSIAKSDEKLYER